MWSEWLAAALWAGMPAMPAESSIPDRAAPVHYEVVVTAGRAEQSVRDVPVKVELLDREDVERSPAQSVDELLHQLPSFNLQRPESSRVLPGSNQSVSYRGLGGSSASRSLVLVDGIPLNEPFAGFLSWSRVPLATIERVEVVPAGGAVVWGNQALGGVIHLITRAAQPATVELEARYGSHETIDTLVLASHVVGPVAVSGHGGYFDTDGHSEVPPGVRGPADATNRSRSAVFDGRVLYALGTSAAWTLHGNRLDETRLGGNKIDHEEFELLQLRTAGDLTRPGGGSWHANLFTLKREAWNFRGAVSDDRSEVSPRRHQFDNPSTSVGGSLSRVRSSPSHAHLLSAGLDGLWTTSEVNEDSAWNGQRFEERFRSGGDQLLAGVYLQDSVTFGASWRLQAGGRLDQWRSYGGEFYGQQLVTGETLYDADLSSRSRTIFSPSLGLRYRARDGLDLRAAAFQSFRAPSPNELFKSTPSTRSFLAANHELEPERVRLGLEAGWDWFGGRSSVVRLTGFWNDVEDAITEVTVGTAGSRPEVIEPCGRLRAGGVCTQRRNLELVRNRGAELGLELHPRTHWRLGAGYTYTQSEVVDSRTQPALEGNWLRRVPEHQATLQASYTNPRLLSVSVQGRYQGERFEEDLNELVIDDAFLIDLRVGRELTPGVDLMVTVQNLLDTEVEVAQNEDFAEIGQPRSVHAGVRWHWDGARRRGMP
jgi:outer membrane receptor protein involved in Fe transport